MRNITLPLLAILSFTFACKDDKSDTRTLCSYIVKLAKVEKRDTTELELQEWCREDVEIFSNRLSKEELADFTKCVKKIDRFIDLKDCQAPAAKRMEKAAEAAEAESAQRLKQLESDLAAAQVEVRAASAETDEAFKALESAADEESREAAKAMGRAARSKAKSAREKFKDIEGRLMRAKAQAIDEGLLQDCANSTDPLCGL